MLAFPAVTNNDIPIQTTVRRRSDCTLVDLTGYTIKVQIFNLGGLALATYSTADDTVTIPDQVLFPGVFEFTIEAAQTVGFAPGEYRWEPVIVSPTGQVSTVTEGDDVLSPGVINFRQELTVQP